MGLFDNKQKRELRREMEFRRGQRRIEVFIRKNHELKKKYWEGGKKALRLGDKERFSRFARAYKNCEAAITKWEKFLLDLDMLALRRNQVKATTDFMGSMKALAKSMMAGASPEDLLKLEEDLETALARGESLEEAFSALMDTTSDRIFASDESSDLSLSEIEKEMRAEATREEGSEFDAKIDKGLEDIAEKMRKEDR